MKSLEALNEMLLVTSSYGNKYSFYVQLLIRRISSKHPRVIIRRLDTVIITRQIKIF